MRFLNIYDPITNQYDTDVALNLISNNEANMFRCYLPFPSGEKEVLGEFFYPVGIDPKGDSILEILDKDSLEDIVEDLEHEHPDTTKEQFWESYDRCRFNPHKLYWEYVSLEEATHQLKNKPESYPANWYADFVRQQIEEN